VKLSVTRSSVLTAIVIALLIIATPFAVWEFILTGELYILSHRFGQDFIARLHGPGRLRFILQPTIATILGARDGIRDARAGRLPFLSALILSKANRGDLLRGALASVRDLVAVAILLDIISQFLIFRMVHPGAAVILGPVLIAAPYAVSRALSNRISHWHGAAGYRYGSKWVKTDDV
jgi:hypothetical protein